MTSDNRKSALILKNKIHDVQSHFLGIQSDNLTARFEIAKWIRFISHPGGPGAGVVALRKAADAAREGIPIEDYLLQYPQLRAAMRVFMKPNSNLG